METSHPRADEPQPPQAKGPWARPTLTYLGNLRDIVHGVGKTGEHADSDPQMTQKHGMG
jgi:hypothetical protein